MTGLEFWRLLRVIEQYFQTNGLAIAGRIDWRETREQREPVRKCCPHPSGDEIRSKTEVTTVLANIKDLVTDEDV